MNKTPSLFSLLEKRILLIGLFLSMGLSLWSQNSNSVRVITSVVPPYNVRLHDYVQSNKLNVNLILQDIGAFNRRVRLKLYIQGKGLAITSRDFIAPSPILLNGGQNRRLTSRDFGYLFELQNLVGISAQQYSRPLSSGLYQFCFEVLDWDTNVRLSQRTCTSPIFIQLEDPPFLNYPKRGENIREQAFQNIVFNWTPRHLNRSGMEYEFTMVEIWTANIPPEHMFLTSPPLYKTRSRGPTLLYSPMQPNLLAGKRYAWQVCVKPRFGSTQTGRIKNNGCSEINYFTYATDCRPPSHVLSKAETSKKVKIIWQSNPKQRKFKVEYRRKGSNGFWFSVTTTRNEVVRSRLKPGETYQFRVGALCGQPLWGAEEDSYTYSDIHYFTMPKKGETNNNFNCGIAPEITIKSRDPLEGTLGAGEEFTASDFTVTVKHAKRQGDTFSGWGYIVIPFLGDAKIKVSFIGIKINKEYQLYEGTVETTYNPSWANVADVSRGIEEIKSQILDLNEIISEIKDKIKELFKKGEITKGGEKSKGKRAKRSDREY